MADDHKIDAYTLWCVRCGQSLRDIEAGIVPRQCQATDNVAGISHRVRGKMLADVVAAVQKFKDHQR